MGKGQWIIENRASLSIEDINVGALPDEVRSELELGYVGFQAGNVAAAMGITVAELFLANEAGLLRLENKHIKPEAVDEGTLFRLSFGERYCVASGTPPSAT
jgi:hypothetical protein